MAVFLTPIATQGNHTMKRISTLIAIVLAAALILPWASQAYAQNTITYVSRSGNDGAGCSTPATACRSFSGALASNKTRDGGIITCVDAEDFGGANITRSMTIECLAGGGAINAENFTINAPGAVVRLLNLAFNGLNLNY